MSAWSPYREEYEIAGPTFPFPVAVRRVLAVGVIRSRCIHAVHLPFA